MLRSTMALSASSKVAASTGAARASIRPALPLGRSRLVVKAFKEDPPAVRDAKQQAANIRARTSSYNNPGWDDIASKWENVENKRTWIVTTLGAIFTIYVGNSVLSAVERVPLIDKWFTFIGLLVVSKFYWDFLIPAAGRDRLGVKLEELKANYVDLVEGRLDSNEAIEKSGFNTSTPLEDITSAYKSKSAGADLLKDNNGNQGSGFGSAGGNNAASTITSTAKSAADNVADNLSGFDGGSSIPKVEDKKPATARLQKFDKLGTSDTSYDSSPAALTNTSPLGNTVNNPGNSANTDATVSSSSTSSTSSKANDIVNTAPSSSSSSSSSGKAASSGDKANSSKKGSNGKDSSSSSSSSSGKGFGSYTKKGGSSSSSGKGDTDNAAEIRPHQNIGEAAATALVAAAVGGPDAAQQALGGVLGAGKEAVTKGLSGSEGKDRKVWSDDDTSSSSTSIDGSTTGSYSGAAGGATYGSGGTQYSDYGRDIQGSGTTSNKQQEPAYAVAGAKPMSNDNDQSGGRQEGSTYGQATAGGSSISNVPDASQGVTGSGVRAGGAEVAGSLDQGSTPVHRDQGGSSGTSASTTSAGAKRDDKGSAGKGTPWWETISRAASAGDTPKVSRGINSDDE